MEIPSGTGRCARGLGKTFQPALRGDAIRAGFPPGTAAAALAPVCMGVQALKRDGGVDPHQMGGLRAPGDRAQVVALREPIRPKKGSAA